MRRKDLYLAAVIGFAFGVLVLLPLKNIGFVVTPKIAFVSIIGFAFFSPLALFVIYLGSRFIPPLYEFGKFAAVGALNTVIDLGVLNFLIVLTDLSTGIYYSFFKAVSFLTAVVNSYFWNKFWTFTSRTPTTAAEFGRFIFFTVIGLVINVGVATLIVDIGGPVFGAPAKFTANIGAFLATVVSLLWNYFAYRRFVFRAGGSAFGGKTGL